MRTITKALATLAAGPLLFAAAAPGVASTGQLYHGLYDGQTSRVGCPTPPPVQDVTGNWSVRINGDKVVATTNLFYDGVHHLAWGGKALPAFEVVKAPTSSDPSFVIRSDLGSVGGADTTVTMSLTGSGELTYVVAPYSLYGYSCESLTLTGHAD